MTRRRLLNYLTALGLTVSLGGCASLAPQDGEDQLMERAQTYWKARAAGDAITSWEYEAARVRNETKLTAYAGRIGNFSFKQTQVIGVEPIKEPGKAVVKVTYEALANVPGMSPAPMKGDLDDPWELIDGQWYHAPKRNLPGNK